MWFEDRRADQGCATFPEFLQNFTECQILWILCSVVFHTFTLKMLFQTSHSIAPTRSVLWRTTQFQPNQAHPREEAHSQCWIHGFPEGM